ncbi:DarT ssDNA thymidine ADP-ribosyltransferase family protein [Ureibacillus sp. FSL K6-2830]|uniref:DarT ssDNA thymidine ADP-ribosyltransferase family protein n=1 Tax=Ureibacillus sp. FSL K6-2830 TaxID=2954610 RepID=UPI0030FA85E5
MKELYWADTEEDPDRKRRRQAEFLVHRQVPTDLFTVFAVIDEEMKDKVKDLLRIHQIELIS